MGQQPAQQHRAEDQRYESYQHTTMADAAGRQCAELAILHHAAEHHQDGGGQRNRERDWHRQQAHRLDHRQAGFRRHAASQQQRHLSAHQHAHEHGEQQQETQRGALEDVTGQGVEHGRGWA